LLAVADVEKTPSIDSDPDARAAPRNLQAMVSLWLAVGALVLFLMFQEFGGAALLFAVPVAGFLAIPYGVVGLARARQLGVGRTEATIGLVLGICILVLTGLVGLYVWEISRSNWQF
jgi:hypothetical protein